jgi:hypothetical protein
MIQKIQYVLGQTLRTELTTGVRIFPTFYFSVFLKGESKMTVIATTLYYDDDEPPSLLGRALTEAENDTISKYELREAIDNSYHLFLLDIGDTFPDDRPTPAAEREFDAMSVEAVLEAMRRNKVLLLRSPELLHRYVWPVFTKGPNKGLTNWKKGRSCPDLIEEVCDRWYTLIEEDDVVTVEAKVFLHEDGTFSVLEKAAA